MNKIKLSISILSVLFALNSFSCGQQRDLQIHEKVHSFFKQHPELLGLSVAVEDLAGTSRIQVAAGIAEKGAETPLTTDHFFRIASNTKTYTAASILRLQELGQLSCEDSIDSHLPKEYIEVLQQGGYDPEKIKIKHLLTHTSGMREHVTQEFVNSIRNQTKTEWTRIEQVEMAMEVGEPLGDPGETYFYSDTGYILLGKIIEDKTELSFGAALEQLLKFDQIGLQNTWLEGLGPRDYQRAHQYWGDLDTFEWDPSFDLFGGGGLVTTPEDLARFLSQLFREKVVNEESFNVMRSLKIADDQLAYRAGLFRIEINGIEGWGHTGFWHTFSFYFPEIDLVVAGAFVQKDPKTNYVRFLEHLISELAEDSNVAKPQDEKRTK